MPLTEPQLEVFTHPAKNRVAVCGRRFGKTVLAANELIRAAQSRENATVWYCSPTYRGSKRILWRMLLDAIPKENIKSNNITDLEIVLKGYNSLIALKGMENAQDLRGDALDFLVVDETQDISLEDIDSVLAPSLADRKGEALYIGTAKGMGDNALYQLYMRGMTLPNWQSFRFTTEDGGNVDAEELEALRIRMSDTQFQQEMCASFLAVQGRCHYNFDIEESVRDDLIDTGGELLIGVDFNVNPMSAIVGVEAGNELHIIDEFIIPNSNTRLLCQEIRNKYPERIITTYPDASGNNRSTKAAAGQTDFTIIKDFGFGLISPRKNPKIADSLNDVNALLKNANGDRRLFIHPRCKHMISSLDGLLYAEGQNVPDKKSGLDHAADALRYLVSGRFSIIKNEVKILQLDTIF